jgi:hypothetical protein
MSIGTSGEQCGDATADMPAPPVGAAEACDLLIFGISSAAQNQKIAAFGSSYMPVVA